MVRTCASVFPTLYDGSIKLVQICASASLALPSWLSPLQIRVLTAEPDVDGQTLWIGNSSARDDVRPLVVPPTHVWVVWSPEPTNIHVVERLIAWWQETGGTSSAPKVHIGTPEGLQESLLERALSEASALHRRNHDLQLSLSTLRDARAGAPSVPQEISELLENLRLAPPRLIYGNNPAGHRFEPVTTMPPVTNADGEVAALVQPLPVWARGLAGIDLHVAEAATGAGVLVASLHAADAGEVIAHWHVPFSEMSAGWLPLRLGAVCDAPFRALNLRVGGVTTSGPIPRLSLAPSGALGEFALRLEPSPETAEMLPNATEHMLALRLWGAAPGTLNPAAKHLASHPLPAGLICRVPHAVVAQARLVRDVSASYTVFNSPRPGSLLVHPVHGTVVGARLPLPAETGLTLVGCEVMVVDRRCQTPAACKLVVGPSAITADAAQREEGILGTSGWTMIEKPMVSHSLVARLAEPWSGPTDVYLFSDYAGDGNGWHAQAVFSHFHIEVDWRAAWVAAPMAPAAAALDSPK